MGYASRTLEEYKTPESNKSEERKRLHDGSTNEVASGWYEATVETEMDNDVVDSSGCSSVDAGPGQRRASQGHELSHQWRLRDGGFHGLDTKWQHILYSR